MDAAAGGRHVVVTGGSREAALARDVAARARLPAAAVLAGRTDLLAFASLVAHADCLVSGDTGVAHLAAAFGTPSVSLFGPTSPAEWGPPAGPHRVLWRGASGEPHAGRVDPGLLAIGVDEVVDALEHALVAGERRGEICPAPTAPAGRGRA